MSDKRVPPEGSQDANIAIVGEAPGGTEVSRGKPFVGKAGRLLNKLLRMSGIPRSSCYLTNVSKIRPPGNNFKRRFYDGGQPTEELKRYRKGLIGELKGVGSNVIIALGNEPLKALTGESGITNYRGSILNSKAGKCIPTFHPSAVSRNWDYFPYALFDLKRAKKESKTPELNIPDYDLITNPSFDDVQEAFFQLSKCDNVAFDIEVTNKMIDMISFCGRKDWSICIPFVKTTGGRVSNKHYWDSVQERVIWEHISELLANPDVGKIAQNANFDIAYMERYGCPTNNLWIDTMNAHHCIYPELRKRLEVLQSIYTRIPYHKGMMQEDRQTYNALDSLATYHSALGLEEELKEFGTHDFYHDFIKRAVQYYRIPSSRGIKVDVDRKYELEDLYQKKEDEIQEKINEACPWKLDSNYEGVKLNPRSPTQLKEYFYERRGYYKYKNKGKPTTNEDALKRLARKYPDDPIPELVLKARSVRKTLGTYVRVPIDADHRMRCSYRVSGTVTGRLSSSKSINDTGTNLQNIQHGEVRSMFVPTYDDWLFTEGDLSGADAMVVAYESEDRGLIDLFKSEADYHSTNTYYLFDECDVPDPSCIKKYDVDQDLRKKSKTFSHGANYGRSYKSIALERQIGENEAKDKLNRYLNTYPGIETWHRRIKNKLKKDGMLTTPLGRKRQFFGSLRRRRGGKIPNHVLREAYSYVPQSVVGDLIHLGFINLHEELQKKGNDFPARIILNIHDSLVVEHHKDVTEEVKHIMKDAMEIPFKCRGRDVLIPVDFETANNWEEL